MTKSRPSSDRSARVALVTGANRGIGLEVCRQLAQRDFVVLLTARDAGKANNAAKKLGEVGIVEPLPLDVADAASIKKAAAEIASRYGSLDVLVNNAGINYDTWETVENADINGMVMQTIITNLLGPWRACQAFLPLLRKSRAARIVNVSSESGSLANMGAGPPAYQVTKAALNALTRTLAGEVRGSGILVNTVCPGLRPIWAVPVLPVPQKRALPELYGRRPCPIMVRPAGFSEMASLYPGNPTF